MVRLQMRSLQKKTTAGGSGHLYRERARGVGGGGERCNGKSMVTIRRGEMKDQHVDTVCTQVARYGVALAQHMQR